jgi:hypothetical protein
MPIPGIYTMDVPAKDANGGSHAMPATQNFRRRMRPTAVGPDSYEIRFDSVNMSVVISLSSMPRMEPLNIF